ncbi:MAG: metal-sensitive transcriptional regulator [Chloroflexi bacterium SZAS-1]|jgi:DNA-binding FrmR family transcriptional regulator|nr:metal-sensitive transcriptional regulator [Chloroflexi bacterium SZAS-1]HNP86536.1 metal-sensitive transcriptional regulator [Kouleothrix sp.]
MMETKQQLSNRLKSIEGHVRGIVRMVDEDAYCVDIIKQALAVQRALEKFNSIILERHLQGCVTTAIRSDDPGERERVITELLQVFETSSKI